MNGLPSLPLTRRSPEWLAAQKQLGPSHVKTDLMDQTINSTIENNALVTERFYESTCNNSIYSTAEIVFLNLLPKNVVPISRSV